MDFNKFIVGKRGLSERFDDADEAPVAEDSAHPAKPGQLFIADNGGVYKRNPDGGNETVLLPAHLPVALQKHSADDRDKRQKLMRLKMMIQMRDLAGDIVELYIGEKARAQAGLALSGQKPWAPLQDKLKELYKTFVWDFGAIKHSKMLETGRMDQNGHREMKQVRPNMKQFADDPDALLFDAIEIYDEQKGEAQPGRIFDEDLDLDALPGIGESGLSTAPAQEAAPAPA